MAAKTEAKQVIKRVKLSSLILDDRNANKGSELGNQLLETSISKYGAGRGGLVDRNGKVIAGNHTVKELLKQGYKDAIIVETEGDVPVFTMRVDVDKDSKIGHELAIADNRVAQANIVLDADIINELNLEFDLELGDLAIDLSGAGGPFFPSDMQEPDDTEMMETDFEKPTQGSEYEQNLFPVAITLNKAQKLEWDRFKKESGHKLDNEAFLYLFKNR